MTRALAEDYTDEFTDGAPAGEFIEETYAEDEPVPVAASSTVEDPQRRANLNRILGRTER